MLAITHTLTSIAIGMRVESVPLSFALALLFHLFADTLLHWNIYIERHRHAYAWVAVDVLGGLLVGYALAPTQFFQAPVLAALVGGSLPDVWHGLLELIRRRRGERAGAVPTSRPAVTEVLRRQGPLLWANEVFYRFHEGLQNETLNPWKGLAWQVVLVFGAVLLIV